LDSFDVTVYPKLLQAFRSRLWALGLRTIVQKPVLWAARRYEAQSGRPHNTIFPPEKRHFGELVLVGDASDKESGPTPKIEAERAL